MQIAPILWNMFLAAVPIPLGYALAAVLRREERWIGAWWLPAAFWIVFLPNSAYLTTGWRHFLEGVGAYEQAFIIHGYLSSFQRLIPVMAACLAYTSFGFLSLVLATRPVERLAREWGAPLRLLTGPFFILVAAGVFLGLRLRFNSWDLAIRPFSVAAEAFRTFREPGGVGVILSLALFLGLGYLIADIWVDGFLARRARWAGGRGRAPEAPPAPLTEARENA